MEIDQRERNAETATQLMKAFGIPGAWDMWPDLREVLKDAKVTPRAYRMPLTRIIQENIHVSPLDDEFETQAIIDADYEEPSIEDEIGPWEDWWEGHDHDE